jgi:hypothetical protein
MCYNDIFSENADLLAQIYHSRIHQTIGDECADKSKHRGEPKSYHPDNHIFRWSHSMVCQTPDLTGRRHGSVFYSDEQISGLVSAVSKFQVGSGHYVAVEKTLRISGQTEPSIPEITDAKVDDYLLYDVGISDLSARHCHEGLKDDRQKLVSTRIVLSQIDTIYKELISAALDSGRHVVDFETELAVLVPRLKDTENNYLTFPPVGKDHYPAVGVLLRNLMEQLFIERGVKKPRTGSTSIVTNLRPAIDITKLIDSLHILSIPIGLRRTIEYLFHNYCILTRDPFYFDVILDLYDSFASLYALLTVYLLDESVPLGCCTGSKETKRRLLDEGKVRSLTELADSLHNAMAHRVGNAFRDATRRDMAVDFRGGLNQIILAADAPVKAGLGIVRRFVAKAHERNSISCVIRVTILPGVRCVKTVFGAEHNARMGIFDVDVAHIMHVASYADYLHEAFHLAFEATRKGDGEFDSQLASYEQADAERIEEIFSMMLSRMFVFGNDRTTFVNHAVLSFSRDISSIGINDKDTCRRYVEMMFRIFCSIDCTPTALPSQLQTDPRFWNESDYPTAWLSHDARDRFSALIQEVGPFFSEYERLWKGSESKKIWELTIIHFETVYLRVSQILPELWKRALMIYRNVVATTFPGNSPDEVNETIAKFTKLVEASFEQCSPIIWTQCQDIAPTISEGPAKADRNFDLPCLDPLPFICLILREYISGIRCLNKREHRIHLMRNPSDGSISFDVHTTPNGPIPWWEYQADKGAPALFCFVPRARSKRIKKQISLIKSFWDVSSELRARRFLEMLYKWEASQGNNSSSG